MKLLKDFIERLKYINSDVYQYEDDKSFVKEFKKRNHIGSNRKPKKKKRKK